jgi:hypothetical protein
MIAVRSNVVATLSLIALLGPLAAQERPLALGQRVRVVSSSDGAVHAGRLVLVLRDTVVLGTGRTNEWIRLGADERIDRGRRGHSFTWIGAVLGGGIGAAIGSQSKVHYCRWQKPSETGPQYCGLRGGMGAIAIGVPGLVVGAVLASFLSATTWEPVTAEQVDRLRVGIAPQPGGGLGFALSLTF